MPTNFPLAPESAIGNPAPFWFIVLFKVTGFTLHMVPMHLWFAGLILVAAFSLFGGEMQRRLAHRIVNAMPVVIALGINFGIVPLLFLQVSYYRTFYPSTILMAWFWLAVVPLLLVGYYGVYYYAVQVRRAAVTRLGVVAGVVSSLCFTAIGFLFANNFTLMVSPGRMLAIYDRTNIAGATTGLALNTSDPMLWPRWLMVLGLATMTTAVFVLCDTAFLAARETDAYRQWCRGFAVKLYAGGMLWFAVMGSWYLFGTVRPDVLKAARGSMPVAALMALTAISPGAALLLLAAAARNGKRVSLVGAAAAMQFVVIALNAVSRQWVQNVELAGFANPADLRVNPQWGPMALFLVLFVVGLAIVLWMVRQYALAVRPREAEAP